MYHRVKTSRISPLQRWTENVHVESKTTTELKSTARLMGAQLRRHRRKLVWLLCMILGFLVRYLMGVIPRVLRRRRKRRTKLFVPFPLEDDAFLQEFQVIVQPLNDYHPNQPKRNGEWDWYCYSSTYNSSLSIPKVLIAQYGGQPTLDEHYHELLQSTSPVNRAFAKQWGMDYVILTGVALDDNHMIPSNHFQTRHSSYNKVELLRRGLELSDRYDWLWIMDADVLIYNFTTPFSSILPPNASDSVFLMAHRVKFADSVHTWNINNGVTIWNLHHPMTPKIMSDWRRHSLNRITANAQLHILGYVENLESCDQRILHSILKGLSNRRGIYADPYLQETVVKHVVRGDTHQWAPGNHSDEGRKYALQALALQICERYAPACRGMMTDDGDGADKDPLRNTPCPATTHTRNGV